MKIAILSDVHANLEALQAALADIAGIGADRIVCLGDIVGYNSNPAECIALLREVGALCIAGNHDRAVTRQTPTDDFNSFAVRAVTWTRRQLSPEQVVWLTALPLKATVDDQLVMVHGALHVDKGCDVVRLETDERRRLSLEALKAHPSGARVCAFGHTHRLGIYEYRDGFVDRLDGDHVMLRSDAHYLLNPGTIGEPRSDERRATYMVFDTERRSVRIRRVEYDDSIPFAKTRKVLPPRLGILPAPVRSSLKNGLRKIGLYKTMQRFINS